MTAIVPQQPERLLVQQVPEALPGRAMQDPCPINVLDDPGYSSGSIITVPGLSVNNPAGALRHIPGIPVQPQQRQQLQPVHRLRQVRQAGLYGARHGGRRIVGDGNIPYFF